MILKREGGERCRINTEAVYSGREWRVTAGTQRRPRTIVAIPGERTNSRREIGEARGAGSDRNARINSGGKKKEKEEERRNKRKGVLHQDGTR